jgi:hypothetical protein
MLHKNFGQERIMRAGEENWTPKSNRAQGEHISQGM